MGKKKLNTNTIINELSGHSAFFKPEENSNQTTPPIKKHEENQKPLPIKSTDLPKKKLKTKEPMTPRHRDTTVSRYQETMVEAVRKAVKEVGKEAATHRFTEAEKEAIAEIVFTYLKRGIRTSENEIARIAVNFVVNEFKEKGKESLLNQVLNALNE